MNDMKKIVLNYEDDVIDASLPALAMQIRNMMLCNGTLTNDGWSEDIVNDVLVTVKILVRLDVNQGIRADREEELQKAV